MVDTPKLKLLTHSRQAETAKPEDKPYTLKVGDGLFLEINPNGSKYWRFRYTHAGNPGLLSMGVFPDIGLQAAKEARDAARKLVTQGINPSTERKDAKATARLEATNSFAAVANEWMERRSDKAESTRRQDRRLLGFAIAELGTRPLNEITPPMLLAVCRKAESQNTLETAARIKERCSLVFRYAVTTGRADRDPTVDLRGALKAPVVAHHAAITDPKQ